MTTLRWTGNGYPLPKRWAYKKDLPAHLQPGAKRIHFRFEIAWATFDHNGCVLMPNELWMPTVDFYLHTPGHVIGPKDLQAAANEKWAMEWQNAFADRSLESINAFYPMA